MLVDSYQFTDVCVHLFETRGKITVWTLNLTRGLGWEGGMGHLK